MNKSKWRSIKIVRLTISDLKWSFDPRNSINHILKQLWNTEFELICTLIDHRVQSQFFPYFPLLYVHFFITCPNIEFPTTLVRSIIFISLRTSTNGLTTPLAGDNACNCSYPLLFVLLPSLHDRPFDFPGATSRQCLFIRKLYFP